MMVVGALMLRSRAIKDNSSVSLSRRRPLSVLQIFRSVVDDPVGRDA